MHAGHSHPPHSHNQIQISADHPLIILYEVDVIDPTSSTPHALHGSHEVSKQRRPTEDDEDGGKLLVDIVCNDVTVANLGGGWKLVGRWKNGGWRVVGAEAGSGKEALSNCGGYFHMTPPALNTKIESTVHIKLTVAIVTVDQ